MLRMLENFGWVGVGHRVDSPGEISPPAAVSAFPLSAILRFPNTKKIRTPKNTRMRDPQLESSEEARLANRSLDSDLRFCRTPGDLRFQLITDSLQMCSLMNSTKTNKYDSLRARKPLENQTQKTPVGKGARILGWEGGMNLPTLIWAFCHPPRFHVTSTITSTKKQPRKQPRNQNRSTRNV